MESSSRLIIGPRVSQATNDKRELLPDVAAIQRHELANTLLVESGFVSEAAVTAMKLATPVWRSSPRCSANLTPAPWRNWRNGPTAPAPPASAPLAEQMRHPTGTTGRSRARQSPTANRQAGLRNH